MSTKLFAKIFCAPRRITSQARGSVSMDSLNAPSTKKNWMSFPQNAADLFSSLQSDSELRRSCSHFRLCFRSIDIAQWPHTTVFPAKRSEEHTSELQSQFHLVCRL